MFSKIRNIKCFQKLETLIAFKKISYFQKFRNVHCFQKLETLIDFKKIETLIAFKKIRNIYWSQIKIETFIGLKI